MGEHGGIGMEKNKILALLVIVEFYVDIVVVVWRGEGAPSPDLGARSGPEWDAQNRHEEREILPWLQHHAPHRLQTHGEPSWVLETHLAQPSPASQPASQLIAKFRGQKTMHTRHTQ